MIEITDKQILIFGKEKEIIDSSREKLKDACRVIVAYSKEEITEKMDAGAVDLVLYALDESRDFGITNLKKVLKEAGKKDIPVVCLYQGKKADMEEKCLELGVQDFVYISCREGVLKGRIRKALELKEYKRIAQKNARYDGLTGLYNRSYGEAGIKKLLEAGKSGAFLMIDLDNFKGVNDAYGHLSGDDVLRFFSDVLKEMAKEKDVIARVGGDEYIFFITGITGRFSIMERASKILEKMTMKMQNAGYGNLVTVSIGISIAPEDADSYDELYKMADKALYDVKLSGKADYRFYYEAPVDNDDYERLVDLTRIRYILEGRMDLKNGAFQVEYGDFTKIYDYIFRDIRRNGTEVQILLFTLKKKEEMDDGDVERAMRLFEEAVHGSLRMVDIGTRYSKLQYIVILLETDEKNGSKVAERVQKNFAKIYDRDDIDLRYDIETVVPQPQDHH